MSLSGSVLSSPLCGSSSVSGREEADPLISFCKDCSESLVSSMKMDGEWPRLAAVPSWWTIEGSELSKVWSPFDNFK